MFNFETFKQSLMMQSLLEYEPKDWIRRELLSSCCGSAYGLWQMPLGINVVLSTQPLEDSEVVCQRFPMYKMGSHSVEVGAGNYLNMQWMSQVGVPRLEPHLLPNMVRDGPELVVQPMPPPIKDGPPVYACYFSSVQGIMTYGIQDYPNDYKYGAAKSARITPQVFEAMCAEFGKQINNCHLFFITVGSWKHTALVKFLEWLGWTDGVVWRSPMFNNLNYNRLEDTLQLTLIKRNS